MLLIDDFDELFLIFFARFEMLVAAKPEPEKNYSGRRRADIQPTLTASVGYRSDVETSCFSIR